MTAMVVGVETVVAVMVGSGEERACVGSDDAAGDCRSMTKTGGIPFTDSRIYLHMQMYICIARPSESNRQEHAAVARSFCCWAKGPHDDGCRSSPGKTPNGHPKDGKGI